MRKLILLALLSTAAACSNPYIILGPGVNDWAVQIQSDTEWSAIVGGVGMSGFGDRVIHLERVASCWSVRKLTNNGLIRAYAFPTSAAGRPMNDIPRQGDKSTTTPFGMVAACM